MPSLTSRLCLAAMAVFALSFTAPFCRPLLATSERDPVANAQLDLADLSRELGDAQIGERSKLDLLKQLKQASDWLSLARETADRASELKTETEQAPAMVAEVEQALRQPISPALSQPGGEATLAELEQTFAELEANVAAAQKTLDERAEAAKRRRNRKNDLPALNEKAWLALDDVRRRLASLPEDGNGVTMAEKVRRAVLTAQALALESELDLYSTESERFEALAELFPLWQDLATGEVAAAQARLEAWRAVVAEKRRDDSDRLASAGERRASKAHPAIARLAEENTALAERRRGVAANIDEARQRKEEIDERQTELQTSFDRLSEKVKIAGLTQSVGALLRNQRGELPDLGRDRRDIRDIEALVPSLQLMLLDLEDERGELSLLDEIARNSRAAFFTSPG